LKNQKHASLYKKIHECWQKVNYEYYWGDARDFRFFAVSKLPKQEVARTLDVGSSVGVNLKLVPSRERIGIDIDVDSLKMGKKAFPDIEFIASDCARLPFKDETFDQVICIHTIDANQVDETKTFDEISRVSSKNGNVFFTGNWFKLTIPGIGGAEKICGSWLKLLEKNFDFTVRWYKRPKMGGLVAKLKKASLKRLPDSAFGIVTPDYWLYKEYKESSKPLTLEPYIVIAKKK